MSDPKMDTVAGIYEAFGRGDVEAILAVLTDDVDWAVEANGTAPWHGQRRGKAEVAGFFKAIADNVEVTEFVPLAFASNDTDVMVLLRYGHKAKATGKAGTMDLHHWWRFRDGKVYFVRGTEDTALTYSLLAVD